MGWSFLWFTHVLPPRRWRALLLEMRSRASTEPAGIALDRDDLSIVQQLVDQRDHAGALGNTSRHSANRRLGMTRVLLF